MSFVSLLLTHAASSILVCVLIFGPARHILGLFSLPKTFCPYIFLWLDCSSVSGLYSKGNFSGRFKILEQATGIHLSTYSLSIYILFIYHFLLRR
jgi:hypothetical protein